jgi:hypothetical protein
VILVDGTEIGLGDWLMGDLWRIIRFLVDKWLDNLEMDMLHIHAILC